MATLTILMCTYNGENYIKEQLDSIEAQSFSDWDLVISDDGSMDKTLQIVAEHSVNNKHSVKVVRGPGQGFARNFFHAISQSSSVSDYFAFADQDDVWLPEKLKVAVNWLSIQPAEVPALYCGATELIRHDGSPHNPPQYSQVFRAQPSFSSALVQPISSGNTMVFNKKVKELLLMCKREESILFHDWWTHILVLGVGGNVFFDPSAYVKYRQHEKNSIGRNNGFKGFSRKIKNFCSVQFKKNVIANVNCLELNKSLLSEDSQQILEQFSRVFHGSLISRYVALYRSGVRREGWTNLALWLGPLFKLF